MSQEHEDTSVLTEIERLQLQTIASNKAKLKELGLTDLGRYVCGSELNVSPHMHSLGSQSRAGRSGLCLKYSAAQSLRSDFVRGHPGLRCKLEQFHNPRPTS